MNRTGVTANTPDAMYARRHFILAAIMLGNMIGPIESSTTNVALPTIAAFFGVPVSTAQWVPMIYLLTVSSLLLFFGRLGDILGYRRIYLAGLAAFVAASSLCSLSPSIGWLIFFRGILGAAAAMVSSVPYAMITASFPPAERGKAIGVNAMSISAGLILGPSLGGLITHLLGWRFGFLTCIPIGIMAFMSGVMGSVPRPHLGVASGILATTRNVGMVLGIATGGAAFYATPPQILSKAVLDASEYAAFLSGLRHAYSAGAILVGVAVLTSLARRRE